ncbi:MAG: glycerophosphodiester phosphodiesterase [Clostridia bacterium]|nr:glycerophosphodiester phosphodiesterase [Clostridia bacterium]
MHIVLILLAALAAVSLLLLFLIFPSARRHPAREKLRGRYIAHRGLHDLVENTPENSLAAFRAAAEQGYMIENDIHLTADGEVVVFHDSSLKRMCGVEGRIEQMTLAELKKCCLQGTEEQIPTLQECLDTVDGRVPLLIEFKCDRTTCKPLCEAANKILSAYKGEYFVQSFYPPVLLWYRQHRKDVCRGQLAAPFKGKVLYKRMLGCLLFNFVSRPDFVSYVHTGQNHPMRRLVTRLGALPVCWTLRSQEELDASRMAFETYIFEGFIPKEK